ncbi:hypothetical protein [Corallococcus sp. CA047B]|uniref:hypothetical protein n=1 Tax=Corallococcus sp. CA047B TaxID=2316729 RepID=UPI0011C364C0|nr:hypothetical protein [Corallococcus sp. CA047B]
MAPGTDAVVAESLKQPVSQGRGWRGPWRSSAFAWLSLLFVLWAFRGAAQWPVWVALPLSLPALVFSLHVTV